MIYVHLKTHKAKKKEKWNGNVHIQEKGTRTEKEEEYLCVLGIVTIHQQLAQALFTVRMTIPHLTLPNWNYS